MAIDRNLEIFGPIAGDLRQRREQCPQQQIEFAAEEPKIGLPLDEITDDQTDDERRDVLFGRTQVVEERVTDLWHRIHLNHFERRDLKVEEHAPDYT